jgi:hypothetical protein
MRRFKLLGLALMAVFIAAVAVASTASAALPKILPETGAARNWTGGSDGTVIELLAANIVKCAEAPATGTQEANKPLGTFHIEFKNCTTEKGAVKCTGLGDAAGVILTLGTWHSVFDNLTTLSAALLFLLEKVHFSCSALVLVLVSGELVCLWLEPTSKKATHLFHCVQTATGGQEDKHYFNEAGTEVLAGLTCSTNEAAKEEACFELALGTQTFTEEVSMDI